MFLDEWWTFMKRKNRNLVAKKLLRKEIRKIVRLASGNIRKLGIYEVKGSKR